MDPRPPVPPFTEEAARRKVQAAEDAWNTCDPERVAGAYSPDSAWRNRDEFFQGRLRQQTGSNHPVCPPRRLGTVDGDRRHLQR